MSSTKHLPEAVATLAAVAFAVLLLLSLASVDPLMEATDAEVTAWWSDSGNVRDMYMSMYFMLAAVPFFLIFLAGLRSRLAAFEGATAPLASVVFAAGICFAAVLLVADTSRGAIAHTTRFSGEPLPGPDTLRVMTSFTAVMLGLVAMPAAAVMVGAASWLIVRTRALPVWLAAGGAVVVAGTAVLVAVNSGPFASPLIQLWVVAAGFELWRTRRVAEEGRGSGIVVQRTSEALSP
jgi:hypothetical protein